MGNNFVCCKRSDNITNIIRHKDELSNKNEEDYLNFFEQNNNNSLEKEIKLIIEPELPKNFQYNKLLNNEKNIYEDNQQELISNENSKIEEQTIYSIYNLTKEQINKLNEFFKICNKNGKPHSTDDFDQKGWMKFYPNNERFFFVPNDNNIEHNKLKIYNENNMNKMKIYQGDLNLLGERHGYGKFTTTYYNMIGLWKNDKFSGWGRESRCNGDIFEGRFENELINGKGIFMNSKNNKYIGDFKNMKRWGKGKLATNKIIYEGEFYNNMIHGIGRIKFLQNSIEYIGTFKNNRIEGKGHFTLKNGEKFDAEIKNGKIYKIENNIIENFNGSNFENLLVNKKQDKTENNINNIMNNNLESNNYYIPQENGLLKYRKINEANDLDNKTFENGAEQINEEEEPECLLSTYRNYGFDNNNNETYN